MKKEKNLKPVYEAPKVFRLDETDSMFGNCNNGNKDYIGNCTQGNNNTALSCNSGNNHTSGCVDGNSPIS